MMAAGKVTDLLPYEPPVPLKVRVIKKYCIQWSPTDKSHLFYLLVDESGNAVEAKISTRLKKIDNKVFLYKCYLLTGYVVDPPQKIGRVVDQTVTIIVGDRAEFHAIDELPIQKQFYSFAPYNSLEGRYHPTAKTVLLTDYLCKIQRVSTVFQRSNINMLKMVVFDHSREPIEITLWEKIAFTYANLLAREKVIAISSLKVTKYLGTLQLESTSATTIVIDLAIEGYSEEIKSLKALTARASSHYGYQTEDDIRNNLTTIGDILSKNPDTINNHRFSCIAKVKEIFANRKWFSRKCTVCLDNMRREGVGMVCKNCIVAQEESIKTMEIDDKENPNPNSTTSPPHSIPQIPPPEPPIPTIPTAFVPPIAPIPSLPRPLAPIPSIRPPNGETAKKTNEAADSDEDGADSPPEYEVSEESRLYREKQEKAKQDFLMKQRAAALAVPTNDKAVRSRLRRLEEPVTLFGEREMERRDRLRMIMAKLDAGGEFERLRKVVEEEEAAVVMEDGGGEDEGEVIEYPFYTEGSPELLRARYSIAKDSMVKSAMRLERARRKRDDPDEDLDAEINWALDNAKSFGLDCSEIGDVRPLAGCSFSYDGKLLATCSLTGVAKIWSMPGVKLVTSLKGHVERATDVKFSPTKDHVATASADRTAKLWTTEGTLLNTYTGHLDRLARVAFHPSGMYLGTTSFDKTWRLWDTETGGELLLQEGHSRSVYGLAFHPDGSLAASCGLDALARVWDLRSGRSILALEGHVKPVLGVSFSPNGYHLATGGEDNTCRIWDLRKKKSLYTIPAHANLISDIKFEPQEGYFLVTASYDMTAKIWSSRDFKPVKVLSGHEAKVTSVDVVADGQSIATVSHDRTIKLWSSKNAERDQAMDVD
ncbi:hypothetical protein SSX86_025010 [Deinandra increscens subsp. villosa]|uniref:Pre-mRNA processing factor 4 (PRP4)-like domain-containing protein n=1 Tax=Deinandra increscens subsp. villosa TaxID=3103831 RepID=A0AAP0CCJ8_9ASTR